ncbi:Regulatory protein RepA [Ensifer psoraleae]|nr:Regulatory protein RepA [Sinorhizobium psoraleae]
MRYSDTTHFFDEQDDLVGSPTLDRPIRMTHFPTMAATKKKDMRLSLRQLAALIERTEADDKSKLPWFKMAVFGNDRAASPSGHSFRSNGNVVAVSGIEADYDGEEIMPEDARDMLAEAGIVAAVYTTPSHSPDAPRWRVFAPFSEELPPDERERHMARLNGIFGGALDDASFTLSQSYYGGNVTGRPKVRTYLVDGRHVDTASDLDATAKWKRGREKGAANDNGFDEAAYLDAIATGESYHPAAIALAGKWATAGVSYIEAMKRLRAAFDRVPEEGRDSRWKERVASLPSILNHVYGKQVEEDIAEEKRREEAFDEIPTAEEQAEIDADIEELVGGNAKTETDGLTFLKPSECEASDARRYVIKGLVAEGDVACIVGAPGVGKSLLAPRLAYAVAQGQDIFGMRVRQGGVLYVAAEDQHGMRARVAALRREHGEADDFALVAGVSDLLSKGSEHLKRLKAAVKDRRPSLVIIDTLAMAFPCLEENSAEGMGRVVAVARSLTQWGAAVILIHHDTKDGQQGLPRGHSLLNGALDVSLHLSRGEDGIVRAKLTKNRNGSTERDIAFTIGTQALGLDDDGDPITAAVCRELDPGSAPERKDHLSPSEKSAFRILADLIEAEGVEINRRRGIQKDRWRDVCIASGELSAADDRDGHKRAFNRALKKLRDKRRIEFIDGHYCMAVIAGEDSFATDSHHGGDDDDLV